MLLRDFIAAYISNDYRVGRDFVGARGWVHLVNKVLKTFERKGYFNLDRNIEVGVEVENDLWIKIPDDCRKVLSVYNPQTKREYKYDVVNGKIKLSDVIVENMAGDVEYALSSFTASSVVINDASAVKDEWKGYLFVAADKRAIVISNTAAAGGFSTLSFLHDITVSAPMPTTGYLTKWYLMLSYQGSFTGLAAPTDALPVEEKYFDAIAQALVVEVLDKRSKGFANEYAIYKDLLDELDSEEFSPDPGNCRPKPRLLPGYSLGYNSNDGHKYIGEEV